jgi:hypothetical protein
MSCYPLHQQQESADKRLLQLTVTDGSSWRGGSCWAAVLLLSSWRSAVHGLADVEAQIVVEYLFARSLCMYGRVH